MYIDNAATTALLPELLPIVEKYGIASYHNPSALYQPAIDANRAIKKARGELTRMLGGKGDGLIFTSCGSEGDNQALFCSRKKAGSRIVIGGAEHAAIYQSAMELKQRGFDVVFAPVDTHGEIDYAAFATLLTEETSLVSVMHVNNETGAVNDIARLVQLVRTRCPHALFHSDGVQAFGHIPVNVSALGVDMYTISGHKLGAPKGIGALYVRDGLHIAPLIYGGAQESGIRAGTENVIGIMCMVEAAKRCLADMPRLNKLGVELRQAVQGVLDENCVLISPEKGAPHICTVAFRKVRGEVMMHTLEGYGIISGIGSACSSKKGTARIPGALGLSGGFEMGMLRLSINGHDDYDWKHLSEAIENSKEALARYMRS